MATSVDRYFTNPYHDYDPSTGKCIEIKTDFWKNYIYETFYECMMRMKTKSSDKYCNGGLYTGSLGLIFTAHKILESNLFSNNPNFISQLKNYVKECIKANQEYYLSHEIKASRDVAFLTGRAGFYFAGIIASKILNNNADFQTFTREYSKMCPVLEPINFLVTGSDELFVGRAGYLAGAIYLKKALNIDVLTKNDIFKLCNSIIQSGRAYSAKVSSPSPLMYAYHGTEYLGAAHGLSGILQILLNFPDYLHSNPDAERDVKASVDFLQSLQRQNGNFPSSMDETSKAPKQNSKELVHWCHGAGGTIFLFAKAYLFWKDKKYLNACIASDDCIWQRGLLRKGPGICHGVGGNGFAHLLLYRLTKDVKYLYRAKKFAQFLLTDKFKQEARTPDSPYSLFEGLAGTVCFVSDLLNPDQAEFCLLPVF